MTTRSLALAGLLLSLLVPAGNVLAAGAALRSVTDGLGTYVPGEVLVKFTPGVTARARAESFASRKHALIAELAEPGWAQVRVEAGQTVADALAAYRSDPGVEYAQPNYVYQASAVPNDPMYGQIWGLKNTAQTITNASTQPPGSAVPYAINNPGTSGDDLNLEKAWDTITDCSGVTVAVVDTGVNYNQEDLASNMWTTTAYPKHGKNFVEANDDPMDTDGHGTHVAGTIGAVGNNGKGVTGVCWKASIMAVRVLGVGGGTTAWIIGGIDFAVTQGAKVINMSLGGGGPFDQLYADAIARAKNADVAVVVAAGNETSDNDSALAPVWPCNFSKTSDNVVCVAALDQKYALADFSNWGATAVNVGAPGTNILSTWPGTSASIADPLTAGWTVTGWSYLACVTSGSCLVDPSTYPNGLYVKNADDRAYKAFAVGAVDSAVLKFFTEFAVSPGDTFKIAYQAGASGTDPFAGGGTILATTNVTDGETTGGKFIGLDFDVTACRSSNCNIGYQLKSGSTGVAAKGVGVAAFQIATLTWNNTSYNTMNGTSMASPAVAGVVTLVRAYNPLYTYADAVKSITASGRVTASLVGKTTSEKAVDAMRALAFIQAPTGVSATVK
jgi:subtilisin family serine protease